MTRVEIFWWCMMCFGAGLCIVAAHNWFYPEWWGNYPAPSGEAVYLADEACVVNMTADRGKYNMIADFEFCMTKHEQLLR